MIKLAVMAEVKTHFRPEFVNRIDEIVVFHALDEKNIESIAKIQLKSLEQRLAKMEIRLEVTPTRRLAEVAKAGFDPVYRRAAAEARDPAADRESAGEGDPRRQVRSRRHGEGRRRSWRDQLRQEVGPFPCAAAGSAESRAIASTGPGDQ